MSDAEKTLYKFAEGIADRHEKRMEQFHEDVLERHASALANTSEVERLRVELENLQRIVRGLVVFTLFLGITFPYLALADGVKDPVEWSVCEPNDSTCVSPPAAGEKTDVSTSELQLDEKPVTVPTLVAGHFVGALEGEVAVTMMPMVARKQGDRRGRWLVTHRETK